LTLAVFGHRPVSARIGSFGTVPNRRSGSVRRPPLDRYAVTTAGRKLTAIATVAALSLVLLAISVALGSLLLLLVAIGFAFAGVAFVNRLLRL
jgi:hypothetical protein